MSASPVARSVTHSQVIPSRKMIINSSSQLPNDYSTTPGGTIYSTTPGGTRIVYERNFLMQLKNSPMAKTPPKNIQFIPGVSPVKQSPLCLDNNNINNKNAERKPPSPGVAQNHDSEQFEMDL